MELFEHRSGSGPEVVVLHGGPGAHHDYLLPGFDLLAAGRTLVYYDQRGGGRSPVGRDVPVGWREHVADLEALRDIWALDRLHLCGYSWGALLAMLYAISHPERVASLALVSPAPAARRERLAFEQNLARRNATPELVAERAALRSTHADDLPAYNRRLFELAVAGYFHDPSRSHELRPFRITGRTQQAVWDSLGDYDIHAALRGLHLPAIVVHGDDDPIPLSSAEATANDLQAPLHVLPACGHVPYVEAPQAFVAALDPFLPRGR
ncbi:MAG: alpha/beta fold hydrolase [Gemmatimonadales bacterium]